jgi:phosphopantetheinyl transferase (holo-ACP synthase)
VATIDPATVQPALAAAGIALDELGIDIIKVDRIAAALDKFGARFSKRVLTPSEQRYVRDRPETFAGRWAAKEAVSKVLGLPRHSGFHLFALGRTVGWIAHAVEQHQSGTLIRPRARYIGVMPGLDGGVG